MKERVRQMESECRMIMVSKEKETNDKDSRASLERMAQKENKVKMVEDMKGLI